MRHLKSVALALLVSVVILAGIGFFLKATYSLQKSQLIQASPQEIFQYTGNLKKWPEWTAWNNQRYTNLKLSYGGPEAGVGAWQKWQADDNEQGQIKVTGWEPQKTMDFDVVLEENFVSHGKIQLSPRSNGTLVTWTMNGDVGNNLVSRYFILFIDKFMAADLETGLNNLKRICEKE